MLVDPRTALQILEYADLAGAEVLKSYCLAVAVCNLDAVLVEARGAFEELPPHLLAELETVLKSQHKNASLIGASSSTNAKRNALGGARAASAVSSARRALDISNIHRREGIVPLIDSSSSVVDTDMMKKNAPRWRLQPGMRPTAARPALGDFEDDNSLIDGNDGTTVNGILTLSSVPLRGESSFKDINTAATEAAEHRLRRTLGKKMQQIENLEMKAVSGIALDAQQRAKVAQKPVVLSALAALDAGTDPEEVQAMLQAAAAALSEQATTAAGGGGPSGSSPPPHTTPIHSQKQPMSASKDGFESGSKSSASKNSRSRRRPSEKSVLASETSTQTLSSSVSATSVYATASGFLASPFSSAASPPASIQVEALPGALTAKPVVAATSSRAGSGRPPTPTHVVGFKTTSNPPSSSEKTASRGSKEHDSARSVEKPPRKGALSMFLRGELDTPSAGTHQQQAKSPAGPAWGGKPPTPSSSTSLKAILNEQQQRVLAGTAPLPKQNQGTSASSTAMFSSTSSTSTKMGGTGSAARMSLASFLSGSSSGISAAVGGEKAPAWGTSTTNNNSSSGGGGMKGASPPSGIASGNGAAGPSGQAIHLPKKPSLREIQEDQERKKAAALGQQQPPSWGGSSPPATSRPVTSNSSLTASLWAHRAAELSGGGNANSPRVTGSATANTAVANAGVGGGALLYGSSPGSSATIVLGTSPSGRAFFASPAPQSKWYVPEEEEHEQRRIKSLAAIQTEERELKELAKLFCDESEQVLEEINNPVMSTKSTSTGTPGRGGGRGGGKSGRGGRGGRGRGGGGGGGRGKNKNNPKPAQPAATVV